MKVLADPNSWLNDLVSVAEAAEILDMDPSNVRRMIAAGKIAAYKFSPRTTVVSKKQLETIVKSNAGRPRKVWEF